MEQPVRTTPLQEGELVTFDGGSGEESFVTGVYRALRETDLAALADAYAVEIAGRRPDWTLPRRYPCHVGTACLAAPGSLGFVDWLVARGHVERLPVVAATLHDVYAKGRDPALRLEIRGPEPEPDLAPRM